MVTQPAPPSSPGSTIDDPDRSDVESKQWTTMDLSFRDAPNADSSSGGAHPASPKIKRDSSIDRTKRSANKSRRSKGATTKSGFAWINEGPQDGNTEDEG